MTPREQAALRRVADRAAASYRRRCWWADMKDLSQEAMVACLSALRTWNPAVGVPLEAYAWRSAMLHLRAYTWRQSSPVSASDHYLENLRGVHHAEVPATLEAPGSAVDEEVADEEWRAKVRHQLAFLLSMAQGEEGAELALAVLLGDVKPAEAARARNVDVRLAYRAVAKATKLIGANQMLYELLQEKNS